MRLTAFLLTVALPVLTVGCGGLREDSAKGASKASDAPDKAASGRGGAAAGGRSDKGRPGAKGTGRFPVQNPANEFDFPLEIQIDVPEVPREISEPFEKLQTEQRAGAQPADKDGRPAAETPKPKLKSKPKPKAKNEPASSEKP